MKRLFYILLPLTVLLVSCGHEKAEQAHAERQPVAATVTHVQIVDDARRIEVQGTVQPERETFVSSRAMGPVVALHAAAGDRVSRNQVLLEIQQDLSHGQLAQAQGAASQAEAALAMAERNYERYRQLFERNSCSEMELDMARMQYEQAKGAVEQAGGAVSAASSVADESLVRSPFDAIVVEKLVNLGDLAAPGRPLVRLQSLTGRRLWLNVREADIGHVRMGAQLPVTVDSRPDLGTLTGRVVEIVPSADMATHTFIVKVDLGGYDLMTGLAGRAIVSGDPVQHFAVPEGAVLRAGGLSLVTVVDAGGIARTRAVTTGSVTDGMVEILSGLSGSERIVAALSTSIPDGTPIVEVPNE